MDAKPLLLVFHGSRRAEANRQALALVQRLAATLPEVRFYPCFLQWGKPDIASAANGAIQDGAGELYLFPYFLHRGNHVAQDLEAALQTAHQRQPACRWKILPPFGAFPEVEQTLGNIPRQALLNA